MGHDDWFRQVAAASDMEARARVYSAWSAHYDVDMLSAGYMNPPVVAALVTRYVPPGAAILDAGAGTGILGAVLAAVGYADLTALDMSDGMLEEAKRRRAYRTHHLATLGETLPLQGGSFDATVAAGVLASGNAPPHAMDELARVTKCGGVVVFTVNELPWNESGYRSRAEQLESDGLWKCIEVSQPYRPVPRSSVHTQVARARVYRVSPSGRSGIA